MNQIASLAPTMQWRALACMAILRYYGIPAVIVELGARRSSAEQYTLVTQGLSQTTNSKHVEGYAFDVDVAGWRRDDIPDAFWPKLGELARALGLSQPLPHWDPAHLEG